MSKPKFKIGDKVKILDGSKIKDYTNHWVDFMSKFVGEKDAIESVYSIGNKYGYKLKNLVFVWDERGLELVKEEKEKKPSKNTAIVIYRKGDETIALDKATGKTAKATCSKDDVYDFYTGTKLALERLTTHERKFKVGDTVIGLPSANFYTVTKEEYLGTVEEVLGNSFKIKGADGFSAWVEKRHFRVLSPEEVKKYVIKVGNKVKVVNTGEVYDTKYTWVAAHVPDEMHRIRYAFSADLGYDDGVKELEEKYTVMYLAEGKAYISKRPDDNSFPCYLINIAGLKKI